MPNSHPNLLKSCTLEVGILSSVLFEAPSLSGVNVCICCGLDLRYLLVAHMLKASAPAWSTREELGYRQEVGPNGSPVIPLEGTPSQSPLAVPLLGLHCLLGKPQPRLGPVESTGVLGREEEKTEAKRSRQGEARDAWFHLSLASCLGKGSLGEPVGAYPDCADVGRPTLAVGETVP